MALHIEEQLFKDSRNAGDHMYKFILLARLLVTMYNHADAPRITLCNLLTDRKYIHVSECIIVLWQGVDEQ